MSVKIKPHDTIIVGYIILPSDLNDRADVCMELNVQI